MKELVFKGTSLKDLKEFPSDVKANAGYQLHKVQTGEEPSDWKPMETIGSGVKEIRLTDGDQHRVIYLAKFEEAVYVLHCFRKKTQKTSQTDIKKASAIYKKIIRERKQ